MIIGANDRSITVEQTGPSFDIRVLANCGDQRISGQNKFTAGNRVNGKCSALCSGMKVYPNTTQFESAVGCRHRAHHGTGDKFNSLLPRLVNFHSLRRQQFIRFQRQYCDPLAQANRGARHVYGCAATTDHQQPPPRLTGEAGVGSGEECGAVDDPGLIVIQVWQAFGSGRTCRQVDCTVAGLQLTYCVAICHFCVELYLYTKVQYALNLTIENRLVEPVVGDAVAHQPAQLIAALQQCYPITTPA